MMISKRFWVGALLLAVGMLAVSACGQAGTEASALPTLSPTITAVPPSTPTDVPAFQPIQLPAVNWDEVSQFEAAMRPEFTGDIAGFVNRNRYYIEASLVFDNGVAILRGAERVRYTNHSADTLNEIVFRLYPNLSVMGGRMVIYQSELNGAPVEPRLTERDTVLILTLDQPLQPGDSAEMAFQFSVAAETGMFASYGTFGYEKGVFAAPEWYPALSVYEEGRGWWTERPSPAGDAGYSESALFETYMTVPDNFTLAMSGSAIDSYPAGNGNTTYHYVSGPMRDLLLVASPLFGKLTTESDGVTVNVFYWPGGEIAAEQVLQIAADTVRIFDEQFGPYPFAELDVAETDNLSAIEYPGIVVVAARYWTPGDDFMEIATAHEIGHQWFYSVVGNDQVDHPWLDELLTSFTEYIYTREKYGEDRFKDMVQGDRDRYNYYKSTGAPDLVLDLPVSAYNDNEYGVIVYTKGPLFYAELEKKLGRDVFREGLQLYYKRNRYEIVTSKDVLQAFEDASGQDLDAFFYQWVGEFDGLDPAVIADAQAGQ